VSSASGLSASSNGAERHGEQKKGREQDDLGPEHDAQHRHSAPPQRATGDARDYNHRDELGQRQDLVENAVAAQHQRRA